MVDRILQIHVDKAGNGYSVKYGRIFSNVNGFDERILVAKQDDEMSEIFSKILNEFIPQAGNEMSTWGNMERFERIERSARALLELLSEDYGNPDDFPDEDGPVGASGEGPTAVTYLKIRELQSALEEGVKPKPVDKDTQDCLKMLEEHVELFDVADHGEGETHDFRKIETTLRRLAREAGYSTDEINVHRGEDYADVTMQNGAVLTVKHPDEDDMAEIGDMVSAANNTLSY